MSRILATQGGIAFLAGDQHFVITYDVNLVGRYEVIMAAYHEWVAPGLMTWVEFDCFLDLLAEDYPYGDDDILEVDEDEDGEEWGDGTEEEV